MLLGAYLFPNLEEPLWIGLSYQDAEKDLIWAKSGSKPVYTNWNDGETKVVGEGVFTSLKAAENGMIMIVMRNMDSFVNSSWTLNRM